MSRPDLSALEAFTWKTQPAAERLLRRIVDDFLGRSPSAARLADAMRSQTGTRFFDWIDHIAPASSQTLEQELREAGFVPASHNCLAHPGGIFPRILLSDSQLTRMAIKPESVVDFLAANSSVAAVEGAPLAPLRRARILAESQTELWAVERHGYSGFAILDWTADKAARALHHCEKFELRQRVLDSEEAAFDHTERVIDAAIADLGRDYACDLFFAAERNYWQRRNTAAQIQKSRQDRLGLGWGNHDHHTYRSSRHHFARLIAIMEKLGLRCRERFYAGKEAGWGAQVMEQPEAHIVVFADVDLAPDELLIDFAHQPLPERKQLGTVGLWCALHGEAILEAGMHHLECQFDFEQLREQLQQHGIGVMKPFTDFPYLRQAFTQGERWPVRPQRISALLERGQITREQAEEFSRNGAIGSHLENLERNEGFKGFNQKGVSEIIRDTDPRRLRA